MESIPEEAEAVILHQNHPLDPLEDSKDTKVSSLNNEQFTGKDREKTSKVVQGILNGASRDTKMKSRRVSFPDGDKIISGYNEAPNPWAAANCTSNDELIEEYLNACQEMNVKPITKLLLQLKEINDFSVRHASLTLKGEKIDTKVVETLEAILRRVQFVIIDLEATSLNDDSAAGLFDMIEYYESAVNVLIGFNKNLGTRGWQAAAHMMRKMSCLRLFDGHSVPLSNQACPFVGRALRLSNTLVTLHLENSCLSGRPMLLIVAALRLNVTLQELFLADNQLLICDALQLGNLLKMNSTIQLLDIRNNLIQDGGVTHLCNGLMSEHQISGNGGLQTLVLWNNQISHQSLSKLSLMLKLSSSLLTLNLGQNYLGDEGATRIKEGLLHNRSLLRLGLVGTRMTCEGAIALAEFLVESSRIIRLDLRNNNIRVAGLMALSLAAKINQSLFRLDIDRPLVKNTIKELAEKQESLLKDISTYTTRNKELATKRVLQMHNADRPIRYMDMTSSSNEQTSHQQQDNNTTTNSTTNSQEESPQFKVDIEDSPTNSPELLPISSVSYHQVSPVMISSSEMEKRANLESASSNVTANDDEAETCRTSTQEVESCHEITQHTETCDESTQHIYPCPESTQAADPCLESTQREETSDESTQQTENYPESTQKIDPCPESTQQSETYHESTQQSETCLENTQHTETCPESTQQAETYHESTQQADPCLESTQQTDTCLESTQPADPCLESTQPADSCLESTQQADPCHESTQQVNPSLESTQQVNPSLESTQEIETFPESTEQAKTCLESTQQATTVERIPDVIEESNPPEDEELGKTEDVCGDLTPDILEDSNDRLRDSVNEDSKESKTLEQNHHESFEDRDSIFSDDAHMEATVTPHPLTNGITSLQESQQENNAEDDDLNDNLLLISPSDGNAKDVVDVEKNGNEDCGDMTKITGEDDVINHHITMTSLHEDNVIDVPCTATTTACSEATITHYDLSEFPH